MKFCSRNLLLLVAVAVVFLGIAGCTHNDDVVKPETKASLTLRPNYLPDLDSLFCYELWAISVDGSDSTLTSLGKFVWDNTLYRFLDLNGNVKDSVVELPEPYYTYDYFAVSVENRNDPDLLTPSGTFILMDEVVDPVTRPISLKFPENMFGAAGSFIVATPTDDTLNDHNENKGVWLCARVETQRFNHDTLGVDSFKVQPIPLDSLDADSLVPDTVAVIIPDTGWTIIDTTVIFGYDTIPHRRVNLEWETRVVKDTNFIVFVDYRIDSIQTDNSHPLGLVYYNTYLTSLENLPDISQYGWRYNAWIFHEYFPSNANLPQMVPIGYKLQGNFTAMPDWKVLPLGAFTSPDSADLSNKYGNNREVPNYPGEDFIENLPVGYDDFNFRYSRSDDTTAGRWGVVVVGMEPLPSNLTIDSTKDFPLFVLSGELPSAEDEDQDGYLFHNYSQFLPYIDIVVNFHE